MQNNTLLTTNLKGKPCLDSRNFQKKSRMTIIIDVYVSTRKVIH